MDHSVGGDTSVTVTRPSTGGGGGGGSSSGGGSSNRAPAFREAKVALSVVENAVAGASVGIPVIASDKDRDSITYSLAGADASLFAIGARTGQISVAQGTALDFETRSSYAVTARAADGRNGQGTIAVTIVVTNVEEAGTVRLSSAEPEAGVTLTAMLEDPDGGVSGVSWQWERSMNLTAWMEIPGGESAAYTPTEADEGYHLRATAEYSDGQGPNKRTHTVSAHPVPVVPESTPTPEATPTPMPEATPTPMPEATPTPMPEATPTPMPEATPTPTPEATPTPTPEATPTPTPEATPTPTPEATPTPTPEATPTPTPEATPTPTPEATPTVEPGVTEEEGGGLPVWAIIMIIIGALALLVGGLFYLRLRAR